MEENLKFSKKVISIGGFLLEFSRWNKKSLPVTFPSHPTNKASENKATRGHSLDQTLSK